MKKILIIEDDEELIDAIATIFCYEGYQVFQSTYPSEAINIARKQRPNLILMDILFADSNGGKIFKALQTDEGCRNIPVIFMTALLSMGKAVLEAEGIKETDLICPILSKPFDNRVLVNLANKLINREILNEKNTCH